ncbi:MAG: PQQ-binding-like beta-propeller repeat protein, partial [Melioribacteraceae bacterium]|nr:PQQ-binding-like beta-propeller repeat protein [Melioribacteraceae bacterium]
SYDEALVFVGNLGGELFAISKSSGEIIWSYNSGGLINTSPLVLGNIILQSNLNSTLDILDKEDGTLLEKMEFSSRVRTAPIYYRDRIILGIDKGEVMCYNFSDSQEE